VIIGCDYSTKAIDLAQRRDGQHWRHTKLHVGEFAYPFLRELDTMLKAYSTWKRPDEECVLYVEQPWTRNNGATGMLMVKVSTAVQVLAMQNGYRVEWAHVATWRSAVFGSGKYPSAVAKELAVEWAREHTGLGEVDDNTADACCIAAYGELAEQNK